MDLLVEKLDFVLALVYWVLECLLSVYFVLVCLLLMEDYLLLDELVFAMELVEHSTLVH